MTGLQLVTPPTTMPITLAEAKAHCRLESDVTDDDGYVQTLIHAAVAYLDGWSGVLGRAMISQQWDCSLDHFPACIRVPLPPLISVDQISYVDDAGDAQTLAAARYIVDAASQPARVTPAFGETWPTTRRQVNAVTVRFTAGYGADFNDVPDDLRHAIGFLIAHWYDAREPIVVGSIVSDVPMAFNALVAKYKAYWDNH